ncbi:MAG: hypothetical protein LKK03_04740 [Candidatus Methanomethylophilus sp.]|nr:hypothetical protein [Methanomethylophilus sp.]
MAEKKAVTEKPNTETIIWSLNHLTLIGFIEERWRKQAVRSNRNSVLRKDLREFQSGKRQGSLDFGLKMVIFPSQIAGGVSEDIQRPEWRMGQTVFRYHKVVRSECSAISAL